MGLIDLHVHAGPSVMPRELDGVDMYHEAVAAGYSAYIIKDHYFPSIMSALNISKHLDDGKCKVFGGLALNNSVGGLNLKAVDAACALGAKIIWMPTVSALRHKIMHSGHGLAFPGSKGMSVEEMTIMYLDENGELVQEVKDILAYLAGKPEVILATGHGSRDEIDKLIHEAVNTYGIKRILVNHPHYMIGASIDDMAEWARLGCFMELNAVAFVDDSRFKSNDISEAKEIIDRCGLDRIVLDSDYGQNNNGSPVEGVAKFIRLLKEQCGLTDADIRQIGETNPAYLLNIEV
ncbi:MAG: hypothetical protein J6J83_04220 [Oscillospiraceae bacterium]|nr:hypothetical protein [Oscillospiraceae bacterium]